MIFKRRALYYAGKRRLVKWLNEDLITSVAASVAGCWILSTGFWVDSCTWNDDENWND